MMKRASDSHECPVIIISSNQQTHVCVCVEQICEVMYGEECEQTAGGRMVTRTAQLIRK